jgi:hypothetical protein
MGFVGLPFHSSPLSYPDPFSAVPLNETRWWALRRWEIVSGGNKPEGIPVSGFERIPTI